MPSPGRLNQRGRQPRCRKRNPALGQQWACGAQQINRECQFESAGAGVYSVQLQIHDCNGTAGQSFSLSQQP
jgi:hypothetical protein